MNYLGKPTIEVIKDRKIMKVSLVRGQNGKEICSVDYYFDYSLTGDTFGCEKKYYDECVKKYLDTFPSMKNKTEKERKSFVIKKIRERKISWKRYTYTSLISNNTKKVVKYWQDAKNHYLDLKLPSFWC